MPNIVMASLQKKKKKKKSKAEKYIREWINYWAKGINFRHLNKFFMVSTAIL